MQATIFSNRFFLILGNDNLITDVSVDFGINIQGDQPEYFKTFLYSVPINLLHKY
jgi:hypothetical protein